MLMIQQILKHLVPHENKATNSSCVIFTLIKPHTPLWAHWCTDGCLNYKLIKSKTRIKHSLTKVTVISSVTN